MKRKIRYLAMLLMSTSMVLAACGGGNANSNASQSASAEASVDSSEDAAKKAEEEALAAAEASRLAEEEAKKKAEEEAKAAEEALQKELEKYGIESVEDGILADIAAACADEDYDAACELMRGEAYEAEAKGIEASDKNHRIVQTPSGMLGIYKTHDNTQDPDGAEYDVYYGEYAGDQREGEGIWLMANYQNISGEPQVVLKCTWAENLPNGSFWREIKEFGDDWYSSIYEGILKDGYYDGDVEVTYEWTDGGYKDKATYTDTYVDGYWEINGYLLDENFVKPEDRKRKDGEGEYEYYYYDLGGFRITENQLDFYIGVRNYVEGFANPDLNR
ncbi:MAG: hypothetical protein IJR58_07535 [Lachnospiraceae bacterium]|nr:hypothetical protein [Lachnospiraceae bacterium]